jgi:hypothetical protein
MNWTHSLERKFGRFAIPGLLRYVAILNALMFVLYKLNPQIFALIDLDPYAVMHGQVWRLVSYIFIPNITSLIPTPDWFNAAMWTLFLWWVGDGLEAVWGTFKLNLFYLLGMIGTTIAAFFFGASFSNVILNSSVFFAFARYYPDVVIYFAYVLPMKVRWVAWVSGALIIFGIIRIGTIEYFSAVMVALVNYLIFFGPEIWKEAGHRVAVSQRRARFERDSARDDDALHRCEVCKRTETTNPELDFRVSADGHEYCVEHLPAKTPAS